MMTCAECGGAMRTRRENYRYEESGLPNVVLEAVVITRSPRCDAEEVVIPNVEELHKAIAQALVRKPARLTPAEVRYLRKWLGWSGVDFAKRTGTTPETVSRWETGAVEMNPVADRLLRLMVVTRTPMKEVGSRAALRRAAAIARHAVSSRPLGPGRGGHRSRGASR